MAHETSNINLKTDNVAVGVPHHITYDIQQNHVRIEVNDSILFDDYTPSHQIIDADIYLSDALHSSADVIVSGLQIASSNSKQPSNEFNYLCDFNNRFSVLTGTWTVGSLCEIYSPNRYGSEAWMGEKDFSSLQWQNYKVEGIVLYVHCFDRF